VLQDLLLYLVRISYTVTSMLRGERALPANETRHVLAHVIGQAEFISSEPSQQSQMPSPTLEMGISFS
jgi:hypothetical protein